MRLGALALGVLSGCSMWSLRPVQRDHAVRKTEVMSKLGVDAPTLDNALAADQAQCDALDGNITAWTAVSVVGAALTGGGGISSLVTENQTAKYAVGGATIALGAVGALAAFLATAYSQKYARRCAVNMGGR